MRKLLLLLLLSPLCFVASGQDDFKIEYGPYLYNVTENEATVVLVTNNDAVSWVDLAPDDGSNFYSQEWPRLFNTHIGKKALRTLHKVTLTGLEKGMTYR